MRLTRTLTPVTRLTTRTRYWTALVAAGLALLVTGCAWGFVTDSQTGEAVPGAQITFHDSQGNSATASANDQGLYAFDLKTGPIPAKGMVTYEITAPGYQPLTELRNVQYDDNPAGTWEVQHFTLQAEGARYYNEEEGFSIQFPADWEVDEFLAELMGATVLALSPLEGPDDWFQEEVSVLVTELPLGVDLDAYLELNLSNLRQAFDDFREHERGQVTIDNTDAKWVVFSLKMETLFGTVSAKGMVYVLAKGRMAYMILCLAEYDQFRNYRTTFEEIAESFRFE